MIFPISSSEGNVRWPLGNGRRYTSTSHVFRVSRPFSGARLAPRAALARLAWTFRVGQSLRILTNDATTRLVRRQHTMGARPSRANSSHGDASTSKSGGRRWVGSDVKRGGGCWCIGGEETRRDAARVRTLRGLQRRFRRADANNSGGISYGELCRALRIENNLMSVRLFSLLDTDGNGEVTFEELSAALATFTRSQLDRARFAFCLYDLDGNGLIDVQELERISADAHKLGRGGSAVAAKIDKYLKTADENGDCGIDWREFRVLWRKFPSLFYPPFALHEMLSRYSTAAELLLETLPESKAAEIAKMRKEKLPPWGRKHPRLFGAAEAAAGFPSKKTPSTRAARNSESGVEDVGPRFTELDISGIISRGVDRGKRSIEAGVGETGDAAGEDDTLYGARRRIEAVESGRSLSKAPSKAAQAHEKLRKQREKQSSSMVKEAQKEHEATMRQRMWDAEEESGLRRSMDEARRSLDARSASTPPRHAAPPHAILSPSPQGLYRAPKTPSLDGSRMSQIQSCGNVENQDPVSPSMDEIWAAIQKNPKSTMKSTMKMDPLLRPTPEKRGSVLAPLPVTPEPPASQSQQPRRWQTAIRARSSFTKSSLSGAIVGDASSENGMDDDSFAPSISLKSPDLDIRQSATSHLREALRGGGGINGGGRPMRKGRGAQRRARQSSMRHNITARFDLEDTADAAGRPGDESGEALIFGDVQ